MANPDSSREVAKVKHEMLQGYNIYVEDTDIFMYDSVPFIATKVAAKLLRTSYHTFCNEYVRLLMLNGVRRMIFVKNKYYDLRAIIERIKQAVDSGRTIFEVCKHRKKK